MLWFVWLWLGLGCPRPAETAPPAEGVLPIGTDDSPAPVDAPPAEPPPVDSPPAEAGSPRALYEACYDRVELPEEAGECKTDSDCAPLGCSREMCLPAATDVMGTCEIKPCFSVLDQCGCHEGRCSWTVRDAKPPTFDIHPIQAPEHP